MEIEVLGARMYCPFCKVWTPVKEISFGKDYIGASCEGCGTTVDYDILERRRKKRKVVKGDES